MTANVAIDYGHDRFNATVAEARLITGRRGAVLPRLDDVAAKVRQVLQAPLGFPPLRQALTPDDRVVVVVPATMSRLPELVAPIVEYLVDAGVSLARITLLCPPNRDSGETAAKPVWVDQLPPPVGDVPVEVHLPGDRRRVSYLASTRAGRRVYLNRTLVDADQLVVLTRAGYDPVMGYSGGLGDVFPGMSDAATLGEFAAKASAAVPGAKPWPARQEAQEVGWLLGMPFIIEVIEGHGDDLSAVIAGAADTVAAEARRLLDHHWRVTVERRAHLVVAGISGDAARQTFSDIAQAFACASRVVRPDGKLAVLSHARPELGPSAGYLRQAETPADGLAQVRQHKLPDAAGAWQLATAAQHAQLYLLSDLPAETVEELFAIPLENTGQVQRLIDAAESCVFLPDAHRTLALVEGEPI